MKIGFPQKRCDWFNVTSLHPNFLMTNKGDILAKKVFFLDKKSAFHWKSGKEGPRLGF